jgi:7-carboxy-7-deazaguanine synthase
MTLSDDGIIAPARGRPTRISHSRWPTRNNALRVTEIFCSLQGEAKDAGVRCTFVRLTGCPLRCSYCDTAYAFHGGKWIALDAIVARCQAYGARHVCVTGGEPLAQPNAIPLIERLCNAGYTVSVETSGALDIRPVDTRASRILDIKTPASGEAHRNRWDNIDALTGHDQIKFVLCSHADYNWARARLAEMILPAGCIVWFSPAHGQIDPRTIAEAIVADRLEVRLQLQLHKLLWGDEPGR